MSTETKHGVLFEYAILHHSKPTKAEEEKGTKAKTSLLIEPKRVIALDENQVLLMAAREIPLEYTDGKLDEVEVVIRPF
jgi:hypothetical protein